MIRNIGVCGKVSTNAKDCFHFWIIKVLERDMHEKAGAWDTGQDDEVNELMGKDSAIFTENSLFIVFIRTFGFHRHFICTVQWHSLIDCLIMSHSVCFGHTHTLAPNSSRIHPHLPTLYFPFRCILSLTSLCCPNILSHRADLPTRGHTLYKNCFSLSPQEFLS